MANVKVRLKDASNNVLHPETDWSVVRNKPSIETIEDEYGNVRQKWNAYAKGESVEIDGNTVGIYSRDTGMSLESSEDIGLISGAVINLEAGSITIKDNVTNNKSVNLVDYPSKPKGVLKSKNMTVQELINDKNLIDKIVKIEKIEFGVGGYIRYRYACDWSWSSGSSGTLNDYVLYYTNESGNNTKLNNSDSILVTYLDLPITWENMPM